MRNAALAYLLVLATLPSALRAAAPVVPSGVVASIEDRVAYGYTPGVIVGMVNPDGRTIFAHGSRSHVDPTTPDASINSPVLQPEA